MTVDHRVRPAVRLGDDMRPRRRFVRAALARMIPGGRGVWGLPAPARLSGPAHVTWTEKDGPITWVHHSPYCPCQSAPDAWSRVDGRRPDPHAVPARLTPVPGTLRRSTGR